MMYLPNMYPLNELKKFRVLEPHESGKEQVNTDLSGWQELPNFRKCQRSAAYTYHIQKNIHNIVINTNKQTRI